MPSAWGNTSGRSTVRLIHAPYLPGRSIGVSCQFFSVLPTDIATWESNAASAAIHRPNGNSFVTRRSMGQGFESSLLLKIT
jgi:hypothetical protein